VRPNRRSSIHQGALVLLAVRENGRVTIRPADQRKADDAEFLMLRNGRIYFEGSAGDLRASIDP
jgi:hypothetical protein